MHTRLCHCGCRFGVSLPFEELSKWKVLHYGELAQHLRIVHFDHALVDLSPAIFDAGDVEENGRVLPERTFLDV